MKASGSALSQAKDARANDDRRVHAECAGFDVVCYERAGQWWVESNAPLIPGQRITLHDAAMRALWAELLGGTIHTGTPGGRGFDSWVKRLRERHDLPAPGTGADQRDGDSR